MIKPFKLGKPSELIIPFTINDVESKDEDVSASESGDFPKSDILKSPFSLLSNDVKKMAENLCLPLQSVYGNGTKSLVPYIGQALQNYKNDGNQIPGVLPASCQNMGRSSFNFQLNLKKKIIHVIDTVNGEKKHFSYCISIDLCLQNGESQNYLAVVESDKVKNFSWLNHATNSLAKLPNDKDEKIEFERIIQECIESQNVPIELIYPNAGWRLIENLGWRYVYGTGAIGVEGEFIHTKKCDEKFMFPTTSLTPYEIFNNAMNMRKICKNRFASTILLLFTHVSTMTTFFEESGFPINFILGIVGVTNSRKTSLTMEFTRIFSQKKKMADAEFTATAAGIEKTLSKYKDAPIFIDDFHPGETRSEQLELNKKLQTLVRYYGNRIPKKRMDDYSGKEEKFFPIQGVCVLTMELIAGVQSSLSRMMIVEIGRNDVQNNLLSYYQKNAWILSTHIYNFILWETENQNYIFQTISSQMPVLRAMHKFEFARFGEMFATFHIIAFFIGNYAQDRGFWTDDESAKFIEECDLIVIESLRYMERKFQNADKGILALRALAEAIETKKIEPLRLTNKSCQIKSVAYEDDQRIFIQAKFLKKLVEEYCANYKIEMFFYSKDEIINSLERLEILEIYETETNRECSRKLPIQCGNHLRYLYIKKELLQKKISEI